MSLCTKRCWVPNCPNSKAKTLLKTSTRLVSFPRNLNRCILWLKAIGDVSLASCPWNVLVRNRYVCIKHFMPHMISATNRVTWNAVPLLFTDLRPELPDTALRTFLETVPESRFPAPDDDTESLGILDPPRPQNRDPPHPQDPDLPGLENHSTDADTHDCDEFDSFVDSATLDHDYFATQRPGKLPVSGYINNQHFCNENHEDLLSEQCMLQDLRKELCRLCGQKGSVLTPLFETYSDTTADVPIVSKIDMYLPIKVKMEDSLPFCICSNCLSILNHWHELYTTCVAADAVLSKTFGKEPNVTTPNNPGMRKVLQNTGTQTEGMQSSASIEKTPMGGARVETPVIALTLAITHNKVQRNAVTQTEEMPSDETSDDENICTNCGESKTAILQEDKLFKEEFDKNFHTYRNALYKCRFCFELFRNSADRKNHIAMCRQLSTICELCGHRVPCRKNLKRHRYEKHQANPKKYLCDKCDRFCASAAGLKFHLESIHGEEFRPGKYCCELCCALFTREIYYHNHKKKHELGKVKTLFQIENFRQEVNSEGSENGVIYVCPVCQAKFNNTSSLAIHLTDKKKVKCSTCRKLMYSEKSVYLHVCEQWTCQYCSKSFDQKVKWLIHERWHTGEKPIKCRKCDQTFRSWQSRRFHEENHEPAYQCAYCGKCFKNKYVFQDHVSCHEGKEFSCELCDKKFGGRKNLGKHLNKFHKVRKRAVVSNE